MIFCENCNNCVKYLEKNTQCKHCNHFLTKPHEYFTSETFKPNMSENIIKRANDNSFGNFIEVQCPKCENNRANFKEIQTRSADEPSTIFYRCTKCEFNWKQS